MKSYMGIAKPLNNLIKKDKDFSWGSDKQATFNKLKETLTSAPNLQVFDKDKPHKVWVDASDFAVSATLV